MFSYDRQALAELFDIFLQLWREKKNIYIVGGNHDRLSQHFIYHEGKKVADILSKQTDNQLHFITTPETHTIEGQEIFFVPYNK
jgi:metallophosphoesterase superfamily enzyme